MLTEPTTLICGSGGGLQGGSKHRSADHCKVPDILVHGQVTSIFIVSVGLSVCLFVCAEFFSAVFDPISIKLGRMLYVWV